MTIARPTPARRLAAAACLLGALLLLAACAHTGPGPDSEVAKAHYQRHLSFRAQGQLEKAALELELAVKSDPKMYHAYYQLGLIQQSLGQTEKARVTWERGLAEARTGPESADYPKAKSQAEMETALASLEPMPPLPMPSAPAYAPAPRPAAKVKAKAPAKGVKVPAGSLTGPYAVLASSHLTKAGAQADQKKLAAHGYKVSLTTYKDKKGKVWHRVWVGCCSGHDKAQALAAALKKRGLASTPSVMKM